MIDLNNPSPNHKYSISVEREETSGERGVRLFKDISLIVLAFGFFLLVVRVVLS